MNVNTPIAEQMLYFYLCGIFIGLLYEILRILRKLIKHKNFLIGTEDVLFFSFCGFLLFGLSMNIGNGQFRLVYLISAAAGAFSYYFTVGKLINLICKVIFKWIYAVLGFVFSPFKKLIVIFVLKIKSLFVRLYKKIRLVVKNTFSHLKNNTGMMYNKLCIKRNRSVKNDINIKIKAKIKK